jgi:hypothetical protein
VRRTLFATAVAVVIMWVATMLIVPLFYPPRRARPLVERPPRPGPHARAVHDDGPRMASEAPMLVPSQTAPTQPRNGHATRRARH